MSHEQNKKNNTKRYVFLTITILCTLFIYSNSLMSGAVSALHSDFVLSVIHRLAVRIGRNPDRITSLFVRKSAHFLQFAVLGFFATMTARVWYDGLKNRVFMILFWGLFVSVTDEFLQRFVEGRVGSVNDIVIDFAGYTAGTVSCLILIFIYNQMIKNE